MADIPNLIIFRSGDSFVECPLDDEFLLCGEAKLFQPQDSNDSYYELTDTQIVLANRANNGSVDLMWFTLTDPDGFEKTITELDPDDLITIVQNTAMGFCTKQ